MTFILIDDDQISNLIHARIIKKACENSTPEVISFIKAEEALEFITMGNNPVLKKNEIIILLDLNLPEVSGWEFLDRIKHLPESLFNIYILSSSVAKADIKKSKKYSCVKGYLCKPLSIPDIHKLIKTKTISLI